MHYISLGSYSLTFLLPKIFPLYIAYDMAQCNIETKLKELASLLNGCKTSLSEIEKGDDQQRAIEYAEPNCKVLAAALRSLEKTLMICFTNKIFQKTWTIQTFYWKLKTLISCRSA